jgi:hypothetical protein
LRTRKNIQQKAMNREEQVQEQQQEKSATMSQEKNALASKEGRMKVYSCVFCEFVQNNLPEVGEVDSEDGKLVDSAFEAKYLYHLRSVHSLDR